VIAQPPIQFDRRAGACIVGDIKVSSGVGDDLFGTAFSRHAMRN
jgi:hypothetical protein